MTFSDALSLLLTALRDRRLEARCLCRTDRTPIWYHAARRSGWLLSNLAMEWYCPSCGVQLAIALLRYDRAVAPGPAPRLKVCAAFEE